MTTATRRQTALALRLIREIDAFECYGLSCVIQYDPCDKTYPMLVDGQMIGNAASPDTARTTISTFCEELDRHTRATTADMEAERAASINEELAAQGLRLADADEAGWYVLVSGGTKVWATDAAPRWGNPVSIPIFEAPIPTRDELRRALDSAVTARLPIPRNTPEWDAAQAEVDRAHEALDPVGYRAAKKNTVPAPQCPCNGAGCPCCDPSHPEAPERGWEQAEAERETGPDHAPPQSPDDVPADLRLFTCDLCLELKAGAELTPDDGDDLTICLACADGRCPSCGDPAIGICPACRESGEQVPNYAALTEPVEALVKECRACGQAGCPGIVSIQRCEAIRAALDIPVVEGPCAELRQERDVLREALLDVAIWIRNGMPVEDADSFLVRIDHIIG